ncbi:MAG: tannase/feruloyl esterase family alpha/beta hydrolase [Acidobacteriota bacterium]|nr:tannase/feruloyl esterase family alpha/beta hydrolase [Acidobacteriota bacterium]
MIHRACAVIGGLMCLLAGAAYAQTQTGSEANARCAALSRLQLPGFALEISKAEWHPAGKPEVQPGPRAMPQMELPAYCRVDGMLDRRIGVKGVSYGIGFAIALPDAWNGRFLMQGGGGLNGTVGMPLGMVAAGETPALMRGFAVASTDTGHQSKGGAFDAGFMEDQQAALDFAYVAVGRVASISKLIVARYYGKPADHAYFTGCSTGGREAMLMAQRYPSYFDGIVSGAPAMRTGHSNLALRFMATTYNQIAPRDESGKPVTAQALSDRDRKLVLDSFMNTCDADDGLKDGMLFNPIGCRFNPEALVCKGAKEEGCLSAQQAAAIRKAFAGPKDSKGNQVYPGFLYDSGVATAQGIPGVLRSPSPPGPPIQSLEMDVDAEARTADSDPQAILTDTASWTNLNTFSGRGGKLIFFHGVSDAWFSALDTVGYYEKVGRDNGGPEKVREWSRLFLVPGMGHCSGGEGALDTFDMLSAVVEWVEKGTAPDSIKATSRALPGRSRPLCPHPQHAHYKGHGDPQDAASFECR